MLIDEVGPSVAIGRSSADAPEIDGSVIIKLARRRKAGKPADAPVARKAQIARGDVLLQPGQFVDVKITDADEHDLHGVLA